MTCPVTITDRDRACWEEELAPWLPKRIFDAHVHVFEKGSFPPDFAFPPRNCYQKFGGQHDMEQCLEIARLLLPGIDFGMLSFGTPHAQTDREEAARYSGATADNERLFGMTMVSPRDSAEDLERRIRGYGLVGYKPYRNFVTWRQPEEVSIPDMLPAEQMAVADRLGLAITLHIPRSARLADPNNQRELVELCRAYPNAKIIVAHIGRAYYLQNVIGYLDGLAELPNAYLDLAMVNHPGVLEYAFRNFPVERILFGSDAPIAWLRGKSVEINNQYAYLMGEPYAIGTAIYDADHAVEFTFFYYEILRGIRLAAERAGLTRAQIGGIFADNAYRLLREVRASLEANP
jgi:predicted TIM-barrel fold metal-dependent hydrolase